MSAFRLHPEAFQDLDKIWEYIGEGSPDAADRLIEDIFDAIQAMLSFPDQGFRRQDLSSAPLRFMIVRDFLIAYAPQEQPVWILAVLHSKRNPRVLAAILRSRKS